MWLKLFLLLPVVIFLSLRPGVYLRQPPRFVTEKSYACSFYWP